MTMLELLSLKTTIDPFQWIFFMNFFPLEKYIFSI